MEFYYDLLSQPSRALYIFFKITGIPHKGIPVELRNGEHLTDEFKSINRFQKVPCIHDTENDFKLSESVAIFRYLMDKNPKVADRWYPRDAKIRALIDEYLEWQHNNTRLFAATYFRSKYLEPKMFSRKPNEKKIKLYHGELVKTLDLLETVWLKSDEKGFLTTDFITFADILCAVELEQTRLADFNPYEGRPRLSAWYDRVKQETHPFYDEAHKILFKLMEAQSNL